MCQTEGEQRKEYKLWSWMKMSNISVSRVPEKEETQFKAGEI